MADKDGRVVTSDSLRFADEESPTSMSDEEHHEELIMNIEQNCAMKIVIDEYRDIFEELLTRRALVQPRMIFSKVEWKSQPMEPFRRYTPKVENAIKYDLQKQLDASVIKESSLTNSCHGHAIPKEDSKKAVIDSVSTIDQTSSLIRCHPFRLFYSPYAW